MSRWLMLLVLNAQSAPQPVMSWPDPPKVQDMQMTVKDGDEKQGKDKGAVIDLGLHPGYSNIAQMKGIEVNVNLGTQATQIMFPTEDGCHDAQKVVASLGTSVCLEIK